MLSNDLIKEFFAEHFETFGPGFSYKDHQLLKENRFQEFIDLQLARSRRLFCIGVPIAILCITVGLTYIWFYTNTYATFELIMASYWLIVSGLFLYWVFRQYFMIKSSMWLFQKMITKTEQ